MEDVMSILYRIVAIAITVAVTYTLIGCGGSTGESFVKRDFNFRAIKRLAVVEVKGDANFNKNKVVQNQIADLVGMEFLKRGYEVIERSQIEALLTEQDFQAAPEGGAASIGKILKVPSVVIVNVPEFGDKMQMTVKMVNVQNGTLLWMGSGSGSKSGGGGAVLGALIGGAVGGAAGAHGGGGQSGWGAVGGGAGGAAGAAIGQAMDAQTEQVAKNVISEICKTLPEK